MPANSPQRQPEACPYGCGLANCASLMGTQTTSCKLRVAEGKLDAIGAILPSSACDLRKLQNIEGVLNGTMQPSYFTERKSP